MKFKKHLFDLIKVKVLSYLGHKPQLFRDFGTQISVGQVYRAYGYLLKAEPLTDEDRAAIAEARQHPESAVVETRDGFTLVPPDPRCAVCPLFIQGIPCRLETYDCENIKYVIIQKPVHHGQ